MIIKLFDSHAHYDDEAFDCDRDSLLESLPSSGVIGVINPGCSVESSEAAVRLAEKFTYLYAAAGIHPHSAAKSSEIEIKTIGDIAEKNKVIAIGEIGLDYHYDFSPKEKQLEIFELQLKLAAELNLPVIIHDREAHADTMTLIKKYKPRGVVHCYTGSAESAAELLKLGFYIGFTGAVTFKNAKRAAEVIAMLPAERILAETDCPYMAPEPFRGKRCDSSMVIRTLNRMAEIRKAEPEQFAEQLIQNTTECFDLRKGIY